MRAIADFVDSIITAGASPSPWAIGVITATAPLTVRWNGADVEVTASCRSYTPAVGDVVIMARVGPQLVALDAL